MGSSKKAPKISIVTPSYNQASFIEETLKSVLNQNYPNIEYIVIDGDSTDESKNIIEKYSDQLDYWVSEPDGGQTDALNKGFSKATGDILGWLCSDDLLEPGTLAEVAQFFLDNPQAEVVYGDSLWIDLDGKPIRRKKEHKFSRFILLHKHNVIPQPSTFWKRSLHEKVGELDSSFDVAMDTDLWLRFSEVSKLHHVKKFWSRMRIYPEQKTYRLKEKRELEKKKLLARYYGERPDWVVSTNKMMAALSRITLKLSTGCYW